LRTIGFEIEWLNGIQQRLDAVFFTPYPPFLVLWEINPKMKRDEILKKIKDGLTKLGVIEVKLAAHPLTDGSAIYTEAEAPAVGDGVYTDEAMTTPAPDGSYELATGVTVVVAEGVIAEMVEPAEEAPADEELAEMAEQALAAAETAQAEVATLKAQVAKLQAEKVALSKEKSALVTKLAAMKPGSVTQEQTTPVFTPTQLNKHINLSKPDRPRLDDFKLN